MNSDGASQNGKKKIIKKIIKKKIIKKKVEKSFDDLSIDEILNKIESSEYNEPRVDLSSSYSEYEESEIVIKDDFKSSLKKWCLKTLDRLRFENLFKIEDEDIDSKKGIDFAIITHIVLLILAIFPYDLFVVKPKKESKIKVSILQKGAIGGMGSTVISDPTKLGPQASTEEKNEVIGGDDAVSKEVQKEEIKAKEEIKEIKKPEQPKEDIKQKPIDNDSKKIEMPSEKKPKEKKVEELKKDNQIDEITKSLELSKKPNKKPTTNENSKDQAKNSSTEKQKNNNPTSQKGDGKSSPATLDRSSAFDKFSEASSINGISTGEKQGGVVNERNIISATFHKCWLQTKVSGTMPKDIVVDVDVYFDVNGKVINYSIIEAKYNEPYKVLAYNQAKESAKTAIQNCSQIQGLSKERYGVWKKVNLQFKYSQLDDSRV